MHMSGEVGVFVLVDLNVFLVVNLCRCDGGCYFGDMAPTQYHALIG